MLLPRRICISLLVLLNILALYAGLHAFGWKAALLTALLVMISWCVCRYIAQREIDKLMRSHQETQTLLEIAQDLGNSLNVPETLSPLATRLKQLVPHDTFVVYVARNGRLTPEHVSGADRVLLSSLEIPLGHGLSGRVAENRNPIVNGNPSSELQYLHDLSKFTTLGSALSVPLEDSSGVIGALTLYRVEANAFNLDQLQILQVITPKLAAVLRNALTYRQAKASATTDYVTGLPNARSLFVHLDRELARCGRTGESLSVMVCDLDGFKDVNDRFGHLTGNRVLQLVAATLKTCCREYDYVARMGGDEFVVVLPGLAGESLEVRQREIQDAVERAGIEACRDALIKVSIGQAQFSADGRTVEDLLAAADRRMFENKRRSKVSAWPMPEPETAREFAAAC